jgi:hypothetical protein
MCRYQTALETNIINSYTEDAVHRELVAGSVKVREVCRMQSANVQPPTNLGPRYHRKYGIVGNRRLALQSRGAR